MSGSTPPSNALAASAEGSSSFSSEPAGTAVASCPAKTKSWIDIQLVSKDGKPIPGEAYRLTLANGTVIEGTLDENGRAGHEVIDPGQYTVDFPNRPSRRRTAQEA